MATLEPEKFISRAEFALHEQQRLTAGEIPEDDFCYLMLIFQSKHPQLQGAKMVSRVNDIISLDDATHRLEVSIVAQNLSVSWDISTRLTDGYCFRGEQTAVQCYGMDLPIGLGYLMRMNGGEASNNPRRIYAGADLGDLALVGARG